MVSGSAPTCPGPIMVSPSFRMWRWASGRPQDNAVFAPAFAQLCCVAGASVQVSVTPTGCRTAINMSTPLDQWLAAEPNYIPHYTDTQQIIGTTILATIVVITVVTFIIIQGRRGR